MGKKGKKVIFLVLLIIIILAILTAVAIYFLGIKGKKNNDKKDKDDVEKVANFNFVSQMENGAFYIPQASENITFEVEKNDVDSFEIIDSSGNKVEAEIVENDGKYLISNEENYKSGETYTLKLTNNKFVQEELKEAKTVIFKIVRKKVSEYSLKDNVKEVSNKKVEIDSDGENIEFSDDLDLEVGDIIIVKDGLEYVDAYKIDSIDGDNATVSKPEVDEIYENLNLYESIKVDFSKMEFVDEVDVENSNVDNLSNLQIIENNVEKEFLNSSTYKYIKEEADKTGNLVSNKISAKFKDGRIYIEISVNVNANGESFLGIEALKNHSVKFTFQFGTSLDILTDIQKGTIFDVAVEQKQDMSVKVELINTIAQKEGFSELKDDEYDKVVKGIVERIEKGKSDSVSGQAKIGALSIPTSAPGVSVFVDLYFRTEFSLEIALNYEQKVESIERFGVAVYEDSLQPYHTSYSPTSTISFELVGKLSGKLGIGIDVGVSFISKDIAYVELRLEVGLYGEVIAKDSIVYTTTEDKENFETKAQISIEAGTYIDLKAKGTINLLFVKFEKEISIAEKKNPFLKLGNSVSSSNATNNGGDVVKYNGNLYYWKLNESSRLDSGGGLNLSENQGYSGNQLVKIDMNGHDQVIYTGKGLGKIFAVGERLYFMYEENYREHICSVNLDGGDFKEFGEGEIHYVLGDYLFCTDGTSGNIDHKAFLQSILLDTKKDLGKELTYLGIVDNLMYYSQFDYKAGTLSIGTISGDGTDNGIIATLNANLFTMWTQQTMYVYNFINYNDNLYLVYGYSAGTANLVQESRIAKMNEDGTNLKILNSYCEEDTGDSFMVDGKLCLIYTEGKAIDLENDQIIDVDKNLKVHFNYWQVIFDVETEYTPTYDLSYKNPKILYCDKETNESKVILSEQDLKNEGITVDSENTVNVYSSSVIGNEAYFVIDYGKHDATKDVGWRYVYNRLKTICYKYNIETGTVEKLYEF